MHEVPTYGWLPPTPGLDIDIMNATTHKVCALRKDTVPVRNDMAVTYWRARARKHAR